jgi:PAS domain S-box-containing protein
VSRLQSQLLAISATLLLGLTVTVIAWRSADAAVEANAQREFASQVAEVRDAIRERMLVYAQVLRGGAGLHAASGGITRSQWRAYVESLQLSLYYTGVLSLGVARRVSAHERADHEAAMSAEGIADYVIRPGGPRPEYTPVIYVEPADERNVRVLGFDMSSEAVRRAAMQRTTDSGEPAVSGEIRLLPDAHADRHKASGLLMYLALYRPHELLHTAEQRRDALSGFVFASFRTRDVMSGLLGAIPNVRIELFDGLVEDPSTLLYDSASALAPALGLPRYTATTQVLVQDRAWTLRTTSLPEFETHIDRTGPHATLAAGIGLSLMLAVVVSVLLSLRQRATRLAQRMTEALRQSQERLSLALEGSNLALFDWNMKSGTVTLSSRWNAMLGGAATPTTTTITALNALVHPDDVGRLRHALKRALKGEAPFYHVEHRVKTHDGSWKWIASHAQVTGRDRDGRAVRITGTNADITERKAIEDMKNDFIATVSHELRTPLTALIGAIALLKEEYGKDAPPDAATFLEMAHQNSERLAALVNDILDLEKVEAGRLELDIGRVELAPFLAEAIGLNSAYADKYGTRFQLVPMANSIALVGDRDRLMQVVTNLLSNAAKHSPRGEAVLVRAFAANGDVRIEVVDRGPGIPEEFRDRIFQKFAQADVSDGKGGTGLGLAISKSIVEAMGGTIGYRSAPGNTVFFFEIPRAPASVVAAIQR